MSDEQVFKKLEDMFVAINFHSRLRGDTYNLDMKNLLERQVHEIKVERNITDEDYRILKRNGLTKYIELCKYGV